MTSTKWHLGKALAPLALGVGVLMHPIPAHAPPPPPPDLTQLPRVKAELNQDVAGATSDYDRMRRDIHRGQVLGYYADAGAIPSLEEAVAIARKLSGEMPANSQRQRDLRDALNELCKFLDHDAALKCYQEGLGIAQKLVLAERSSDAANRDVVSSLFAIGWEAWSKQDQPAALAAYREGLNVSRAMVKRYPKTNAVRYYWQGEVVEALGILPSISGSGISWDEYTKEMSERAEDMKKHGFSDPPYID
jgi:tetratricopeptide (TPR) repeat protein